MNYITKVQTTGGSLRTTIPKFVADMMNIKEKDHINWIINPTTGQVILEKIQKE